MNTTGALLEGIRVIELGNFIAAPFAARVFADFGAEVIKVERPGTGDELRDWRKPRGETSMMFRTLGRNKKSVALDLHREHGQEAVRRLAQSADVVLENFRPGTLERWGLGPEDLAALNPDLAFVRISGYGQTGPYRQRAGFGSAAESFAGLRYITGEPDRPAGRSAAPLGDTVAGLYAVIGALMLLLDRARGKGSTTSDEPDAPRVVDVALYEGIHTLLESLVPDFDAYGVVRQRSGGKLPGVVPAGAYPCKGGLEVVIGGNSASVFSRLMRAIGHDDLAEDETLQRTEARGEREDELNGLISKWTSVHDLETVLHHLDEAGVPAAPVYDARSLADDPHYIARDMVQAHKVKIDGEPELIRFPGVVPKIPGREGQVRWVGPEVGEHTAEVLASIGMTPETDGEPSGGAPAHDQQEIL
ncbi:CaiB/BaiF CoA transferase family protein [Arthrobacter pigmenti]